MPRGDKSKYTEKQKRQAEHIGEGYEERGVPEEEAERRAWATVNEMTGGGKQPGGSGRGKPVNKASAKKGGRIRRPTRRSRGSGPSCGRKVGFSEESREDARGQEGRREKGRKEETLVAGTSASYLAQRSVSDREG